MQNQVRLLLFLLIAKKVKKKNCNKLTIEKDKILEISEISFFFRIYNKFKKWIGLKFKGIIFKGNVIQIERAPEPTDINWENCGYTTKEKIHNRINSFLMTAVLLIVVFFIFIFL